jgi:hypothetical protein
LPTVTAEGPPGVAVSAALGAEPEAGAGAGTWKLAAPAVVGTGTGAGAVDEATCGAAPGTHSPFAVHVSFGAHVGLHAETHCPFAHT